MDTNEYLDVFIDESTEHLEVLSKKLLALEKNPNDIPLLEEIFRAAHTLKGMSATMGFQDLASLTHKLENVFDKIRNNELDVDSDKMDVLLAALDKLSTMVEDIASGGDGKNDVTIVVEKLNVMGNDDAEASGTNELLTGENVKQPPIFFTELNEFEQSILNESKERGFFQYEIQVKLQDDCLLKGARVFMVFDVMEKFGEVLKSLPTVNELEEENFDNAFTVLFVSTFNAKDIESAISKVSEIHSVHVQAFDVKHTRSNKASDSEKETKQEVAPTNAPSNESHGKHVANKTIRVNIERLDSLMNLFEELIIDRGRLEQISYELKHPELTDTVERISRVSGDMQDMILTMRMVPIDHVFSRFPRMIRQLARELEKEIAVDVVGADTEMDRTVIDEIGDPLVHLIRNAIDHGIESPEERLKQNKPAEGTLKLTAYHSGNHVFIEISDDGAGIDKEKVIAKAIKNHIITSEQVESMADEQVYALIMESGFSTSDTVSDISGRGVGLDVVKNKIESLGGHVSIESAFGKGSVFSIQLPLTLSIVSALLVELNTEKYAIPLSTIVETAVIHKKDIISAHHKQVIDFRGVVVPLTFLHDLFHVPKKEQANDDYYSIVIVQKGNKMTGLVVDSFIGQQEVVLKSLGQYLTDVFAISGATILGDGEVALIIDSAAFIE